MFYTFTLLKYIPHKDIIHDCKLFYYIFIPYVTLFQLIIRDCRCIFHFDNVLHSYY